MDQQAQFHQLMLERQQRLEQALLTALKGSGTDEDWAVICSECGISPMYILKGKRNGNHSDSTI